MWKSIFHVAIVLSSMYPVWTVVFFFFFFYNFEILLPKKKNTKGINPKYSNNKKTKSENFKKTKKTREELSNRIDLLLHSLQERCD